MTAIFAGNLATHLSGHWPKAARANAVQIALADRLCVSEAEKTAVEPPGSPRDLQQELNETPADNRQQNPANAGR